MNAKDFLDLSTKLVSDLKAWVVEAANDNSLSPSDLETLRAATQIVERVTLREVDTKSETEPGSDGHVIF
jgi:hypothetical protein